MNELGESKHYCEWAGHQENLHGRRILGENLGTIGGFVIVSFKLKPDLAVGA